MENQKQQQEISQMSEQPDFSDRSRSTLFVSTIPYSATSEQLQDFFSDIGPVRSCFVVADKTAKNGFRNKGYGYVAYALPEDAERAVRELKKKPFLETRTLKLELAVKKKVAEERKNAGFPLDPEHTQKRAPKKPKPEPTSVSAQTPSQAWKPRSRHTTVRISDLAEGIDKKQVYKKVRKYGEVVKVVYPVSEDDKLLPGVADVIYSSSQDAENAVKHLDQHQFKGFKITAKNTAEEAKPAKQARLIIRNLPWQCTPAHLRKVFAKHGAVVDIQVPHAADGKARGFGFVQYATPADAENAIDAINGTEIMKRPVAVDWALPKAQYDRAIQEDQEQSELADDVEVATANDAERDEHVEEEKGAGEESDTRAQHEAQEDEFDNESEEEGDQPSFYIDREGVSDAEENDATDREEEGSSEGGDNEGSDDDVEVTFEGKEHDGASGVNRERRELKQGGLAANVTEECTLFVRNLSFETTQEELADALSTFGPLRYARVTMDRITGRSRGTGFICYRRREDADACLAAYDKAQKAAALLEPVPVATEAKNQKQQKKLAPAPSILTPEPSLTAGTTPFLLGGRFLNIALAVDRSQANQLTEERKLRRRAEDKRNLYLMREGVIFPDSEAAKGIPASELSKRQTSYAERKRLLAVNPNLFISKTRLSVRNLGLKVDEKELKKVALLAVKKFWEEVNKGQREGIEPEVMAEEQEEGRAPPSIKRKPVLIQAKILRSKDRIDAATKLPRSKGYGFIEFEAHADALACLRWMNNNPRTFAPPPVKGEAAAEDKDSDAPIRGKRPIVEFAIENQQVVKRRDERRKQQVQKTTKRKREDEEGDEKEDRQPPKRKRFGEYWKEQRLARKEKKAKSAKSEGGAQVDGQKKTPGEQRTSARKTSDGQSKGNKKRKQRDGDMGNQAPSITSKVQKTDKGTRPADKRRREEQPSPSGNKRVDKAQASGGKQNGEPESKKKNKKSTTSKAEKRDQQDERNFESLVQKYKKNLFGNDAKASNDGKKTGGTNQGEGGISRWFA